MFQKQLLNFFVTINGPCKFGGIIVSIEQNVKEKEIRWIMCWTTVYFFFFSAIKEMLLASVCLLVATPSFHFLFPNKRGAHTAALKYPI